MEPRVEVEQLLKASGAVLKRNKKHEVWELPNGHTFTRANTPSDYRADANSLADLKRILSQNGTKAPVVPPIKVPDQTSPKMRKVEKVFITPAQAASWLELNVRNRIMDFKVWGQYAEDMRNGRWMYNFQPIIFSSDNTLIDGQHRLKAVVASGVPIYADVVFDAPPDIMATVDIGFVRTVAHSASLAGVTNATQSSAIARMLLLLDANDGVYVNSSCAVTKPVVLRFVMDHAEELSEVCRIVEPAGKLASRSILGAAYIKFKRVNPEMAKRFFALLTTGVGISEDSPVYLLRERMITNRTQRAKVNSQHILALTVKAWNLFVSGKTVKRLSWDKDGEAFPQVQGSL